MASKRKYALKLARLVLFISGRNSVGIPVVTEPSVVDTIPYTLLKNLQCSRFRDTASDNSIS